MRKIYLQGYLEKNLGDDLFFKIITDRFPNTQFISYSSVKYKNINQNLKIYSSLFYRIVNKLLRIITNENFNISYFLKNKCDLVIHLGGSIFYDNDDIKTITKLIKMDYLKPNKPYYILGSNINTYRNKEYINTISDRIFKFSQDVCLRDKKSYQNFKDLKNVRYAPDIVFSYRTKKEDKSQEKRILFSVIQCSKKTTYIDDETYENKIIEIIKKFYEDQYIITLMSFCKYEGDENTINSIENTLKKDNIVVDKYLYDGDIKTAMDIINKHEIIIGSRFHANVIGLILNKTVIPIVYSNKTKDMLDDIEFKGCYIDLAHIKQFDINNLNEKILKYKCNIQKERHDAENHFEKLDQILK